MDGMPILIDRSTIALALAPTLEDVDFSTASLYRVLQERYGIRPARARFAIDAIAADDRQASLLGLSVGGPLLRCSQATEDDGGRTIERCDMVYRGDRYRFRATLVRAGSSDPAVLRDGAGYWDSDAPVPRRAVTMGLSSLLAARHLVVVAAGEHKRAIVERTLRGPITPTVPASHLRLAVDATVLLDRAAAGDGAPA